MNFGALSVKESKFHPLEDSKRESPAFISDTMRTINLLLLR